MAAPLIILRQGDRLPALSATILTTTGSAFNLTGCTVKFVMRTMGSVNPVVNASATITSASAGTVSYAWAAADTATSGTYIAEFVVTDSSGNVYSYPNDGWLTVEITPPLGTVPNELVTLADAKDVLNIPSTDTSNDSKIMRFLRGTRPLIEQITGPIIPTQYEEWHDGGQYHITVRRRPSAAWGTSPLLIVQAISEYNGPIEWPLSIISSPDEGQLYSAMVDVRLGRITRRTAGGAVQPFPNMPQAVHVWYTAGQQTVPDNVYDACLELVRLTYQQTQQGRPRAGTGGLSAARDDGEPQGPPVGYFIPGRVREMLYPNRRYPSIA